MLEDILERLASQINMTTDFRGEKGIERALAMSIPNLMGELGRAEAGITSTGINAQAQRAMTTEKEAGDTFRQRLLNDANIILREMAEKGQTRRTGMEQAGANYRTKLAGDYQTSLQKDKYRLDENLADSLNIIKTRALDRYNQMATPGGIGRTVDEIEGAPKKKEGYGTYGGFGSLNPWFGVEDYGE